VKVFVREDESRALELALLDKHIVASEAIEVEVRRAVRRLRPAVEGVAKQFLGGMSLIAIDDHVRALAAAVEPPYLRALDAIHLATALLGDVDEFVAYDRRLVDAARGHGLQVLSPA
jgi:uncharacterized protein